jgi:peroxiredoxin
MSRSVLRVLGGATVVILAACNKSPSGAAQTSAAQGSPSAAASSVAPSSVAAPPIAEGTAPAEVGKPAPDFTLKDLAGKEVRLSSFKGKVVVLEWFNPDCPFVKRSHTKGSLKDTAKKQEQRGVAWLAINSAAEGKQGYGAAANREAAKSFGLEHPVLLDESGQVGKTYGATNTPHMFVIDDKGILRYKGAIDNSPDGEGESAPGGKLVSYVDEALAAVAAGKPVTTAETKAYGCGVKYGH